MSSLILLIIWKYFRYPSYRHNSLVLISTTYWYLKSVTIICTSVNNRWTAWLWSRSHQLSCKETLWNAILYSPYALSLRVWCSSLKILMKFSSIQWGKLLSYSHSQMWVLQRTRMESKGKGQSKDLEANFNIKLFF